MVPTTQAWKLECITLAWITTFRDSGALALLRGSPGETQAIGNSAKPLFLTEDDYEHAQSSRDAAVVDDEVLADQRIHLGHARVEAKTFQESRTIEIPATQHLSNLCDRASQVFLIGFKPLIEDYAQHTRAHAVRLFVEAIAQFVREQINGELIVENGHELTTLILRTEKNVRAAFQISQQLHAAKRQVWQAFQARLRQQISHLQVEILVD